MRRHWEMCDAVGADLASKPKDRLHEHKDVPEGLTMEAFFEYANVDAPQHCFKENLAVPWLDQVL